MPLTGCVIVASCPTRAHTTIYGRACFVLRDVSEQERTQQFMEELVVQQERTQQFLEELVVQQELVASCPTRAHTEQNTRACFVLRDVSEHL